VVLGTLVDVATYMTLLF